MIKNLLAIDPGSNSTGLAFFEDGELKGSLTLSYQEEKDRLKKRLLILRSIKILLPHYSDVACEAPFLQGVANQSMQRFLGVIEFFTWGKVSFFHPMTVKKAMGSGKMEKIDMAKAAIKRVSKKEGELIEAAIQEKAFDETDAVCVGLTYLKHNQGEKSAP